MQCPSEIAVIIHEILRIGILRIRSCGWNKEPARCAIEADHLHNLPALLSDYRLELLEYYLQVERVSFVNQSSTDDVANFQPLWNSLSRHSTSAKRKALAS
jgi:hypothetical protein